MKTITICTDAGHKNLYKQSCAVWACYIRTPSQAIHSSGIIKQSCKGSSQAELYAIANALYIVARTYDLSKYKLIVYSDNIYALRNHLDGTLGKSKPDRQEVYDNYIKPHIEKALVYEARWVKAHLDKKRWNFSSARHFMQNWCDEEVHRIMKIESKRIAKVRSEENYRKKACVLDKKSA